MHTPIASSLSLSSRNLASGFSLDGLETSDLLSFALKDVQHQLQQFFASPTAFERLQNVFDITHPEAAQTLIAGGSLGQFDLPQIQVLDDEGMNGARGAYSSDRQQIYLCAEYGIEWLQSYLSRDRTRVIYELNASDIDSIQAVADKLGISGDRIWLAEVLQP
ncbi:hypothetical protein H6F88_25855 [Oculatella sp. FACHB-28]|uniref:hypothetical protein n=1 Tax=Oculatella sp. FACHB-28 TaxID=2692845 RepID=UPI001687AF5A|nr:hypothetical protein [Oculatella sp. FACHB-28]MBD2059382.1 hypothetical protein [Oculatella sp. FACHB-28]